MENKFRKYKGILSFLRTLFVAIVMILSIYNTAKAFLPVGALSKSIGTKVKIKTKLSKKISEIFCDYIPICDPTPNVQLNEKENK